MDTKSYIFFLCLQGFHTKKVERTNVKNKKISFVRTKRHVINRKIFVNGHPLTLIDKHKSEHQGLSLKVTFLEGTLYDK